jgi:hypothetical protein
MRRFRRGRKKTFFACGDSAAVAKRHFLTADLPPRRQIPRTFSRAAARRKGATDSALLDWCWCLTSSHAHAQVVVAIARVAPAAVRAAQAPRRARPATAAVHALRGLRRTRGIHSRLGRIVAQPILAPFPEVSVHVVQAPGVWLLFADRMGLTAAVAVEPSVVAQPRLVVAKAP